MAEILAAIEAEIRASEGVAWKELLLPANRYRVFIIVTLQIGMSSSALFGAGFINQRQVCNLPVTRRWRIVSFLAVGTWIHGL